MDLDFIEVPKPMMKKMEKLFKKMENKSCKVEVETDDETI